jgi:tubulin beta
MYVPRALLFGLEPGVIGAARVSPLGGLLCPGSLVSANAGAGSNWAKGHCMRAGHELCLTPL